MSLSDPKTQEMDKILRQRATRNPVLVNILAKHGGQFTTEALYEAAIELDSWANGLANIAIQQMEKASGTPIPPQICKSAPERPPATPRHLRTPTAGQFWP
jgi:hypothetical protein